MEAALMLGAWVELSLTCVKFPSKSLRFVSKVMTPRPTVTDAFCTMLPVLLPRLAFVRLSGLR